MVKRCMCTLVVLMAFQSCLVKEHYFVEVSSGKESVVVFDRNNLDGTISISQRNKDLYALFIITNKDSLNKLVVIEELTINITYPDNKGNKARPVAISYFSDHGNAYPMSEIENFRFEYGQDTKYIAFLHRYDLSETNQADVIEVEVICAVAKGQEKFAANRKILFLKKASYKFKIH